MCRTGVNDGPVSPDSHGPEANWLAMPASGPDVGMK